MIKEPNGKGKSTLLKLISGLYRPTSGKIDFGDIDTTAIHLKSLSAVYSYISQNSNILSGNMKNNIALSNDYDADKMKDVIESLGLTQA